MAAADRHVVSGIPGASGGPAAVDSSETLESLLIWGDDKKKTLVLHHKPTTSFEK